MGGSAYRKAARTFRAIARAGSGAENKAAARDFQGGGSEGSGALFQSYTISR